MKTENTVGFILPNAPAYSETFFNSKFRGLQRNNFRVIVFTDSPFTGRSDFKIVSSNPVNKRNLVVQSLLFLKVFTPLVLKKGKRALRFLHLERKSGRSWRTAIENLYKSSHILLYDLDWIHFGFATMGIGRENLGKAMNAKSGVSFRGYDISIYPLKNPGCYDLLWKKLDRVHSISDFLYNKAVEMGLSPDLPYRKITPAVNTDFFCPPETNPADGRKKTIMVSTGRLIWKKGYDYAFMALAELKKEGRDFEFRIIGKGDDYEYLRFAAYQLGIEKEIVFMGMLSPEEISEQLKLSDIYLQPSVQEGFCNSVIEAQASGLISITSDTGGLPENIENGITGFLFKSRDAGDLKNRILKVLDMTLEDRATMGKNARTRAVRHFNIKEQENSFVKFFSLNSEN